MAVRHPVLAQSPFAPMTAEEAAEFSSLVTAALNEDGARHDATSDALISEELSTSAEIVLRSPAVVAGIAIAALAFQISDSRTTFEGLVRDGAALDAQAIARVSGTARAMLSAERVALNFVGRLSGIATLTRQFVAAVSDLPVRICDTRKTTPGLRRLERYAVRAGSGYNHRFNLSDAVLIKDNHLAAVGSVKQAIARAREHVASGLIVEVECESVAQVQEAIDGQADAVLLDNMPVDEMRRAVAIAHGKAAVEASGGVTLENVRQIALTGVDIISVGALTHGARSADVALEFVQA